MKTKQIEHSFIKAGIDTSNITFSNDAIEVCVGYKETENNGKKFGSCDERKTNALKNKIRKTFPYFNYFFKTAYGSWVMEINGSFNYFVANNID